MSEWQPIETAPIGTFNPSKWYLDTLRCLVVSGYVDIATYGFTSRGKGRWKNSMDRICYPTHWMLLPEPPK